MRILLDEDSMDRKVRDGLLESGHDVATILEFGLKGVADALVLKAASVDGRVVLTKNTSDFRRLHSASSIHPGIRVHCSERGRFLDPHVVVAAVNTLSRLFPDIAGQFLALNDFR
jgi:hypothetical protein